MAVMAGFMAVMAGFKAHEQAVGKGFSAYRKVYRVESGTPWWVKGQTKSSDLALTLAVPLSQRTIWLVFLLANLHLSASYTSHFWDVLWGSKATFSRDIVLGAVELCHLFWVPPFPQSASVVPCHIWPLCFPAVQEGCSTCRVEVCFFLTLPIPPPPL